MSKVSVCKECEALDVCDVAGIAVAVQQLQKEASNYRTLGQYKDQFASLQVAAAAPAVAEVQS